MITRENFEENIIRVNAEVFQKIYKRLQRGNIIVLIIKNKEFGIIRFLETQN